MSRSSSAFRVGTRPSNLAVRQTQEALDRLRGRLPGLAFEMVRVSSPGDRDRTTDLRASPPDFFTRDLDAAVRSGDLDFAVHSAKDLPAPMPPDLDWFWLPWRADERDALVLRPGTRVTDLPPGPVVGVSSERRDAYARARFPGARLLPIRGNIEERLQQLDEGRYDVLIMAGAALERLGLLDRVTEWIPLPELAPPEGQGSLAVTYRLGDARLNRLRWPFVKAVRFVSAGAGDAAHLTLGGRQALERAEVCLFDALMDERTLGFLPTGARRMDVGKRHGDGGASQDATTQAILDEVRKGRRVVRLKGGDAGLFGRLAEEVDALDRLELPYEVLPGVSSLAAATTGTGLLLTRRGVSRGFCALTPRGAGGTLEPFDAAARASLPIVFFMALRVADEVARGLLAEGRAADTPAAIVLDAGGAAERVIRTTLGGLPAAATGIPAQAAGLLIVGEVCRYGRQRRAGALGGRRVLLTCSEALLSTAEEAVTDAGGVPVPLPLQRLALRAEAVAVLRRVAEFDWIVLTSPSAVECFLQGVGAASVDLRRIPRLMVCGPGTARALWQARLTPDVIPPRGFGAEGLVEAARAALKPGDRVLRLRSTLAGGDMADALTRSGATVTDCILYENQPLRHSACPTFDAVFFASASAVASFVEQGFAANLGDRVVVAIGAPTAEALARGGLRTEVVGEPATVAGAMERLGDYYVRKEIGP